MRQRAFHRRCSDICPRRLPAPAFALGGSLSSRRKGFDEPRQCFPQCGLFLLVGDAQTDDCQALCRGNQYILSPVAHTGEQAGWASSDRKRAVWGKSVSVRVVLGCRRSIKKKKK